MSLTAHLLFSEPTLLPKGKVRKHRMDPWWHSDTPESVFAREHCAQTKSANIEKVFDAIVAGADTALAIADASQLSLATVQKALHELEDWPDKPRIVRIRGAVAHRFRCANDS